MKWSDWLKSRGIEPDSEMPVEGEHEDKKGKEQEEKSGKEQEEKSGKEQEVNNLTPDQFTKKIDELQKEVISLKESNRNLALMGRVEQSTRSVEAEIDAIIREM